MKRLFIVLLSTLALFFANAQVFNTISYYDKFDDVLKTEQRKTLIQKTDTTFVIEEKGGRATTYYILNVVEAGTMGSKDNIVNLIDNVYGYETSWCVVKYDLIDKYNKAYLNFLLDSTSDNMKILQSFWIFAVNRIVTTQYSGIFQREYFWLTDELNTDRLGKGVNRIVYSR